MFLDDFGHLNAIGQPHGVLAGEVVLFPVFLHMLVRHVKGRLHLISATMEIRRAFENIAHFADQRIEYWIDSRVEHIHGAPLGVADFSMQAVHQRGAVAGASEFRDARHAPCIRIGHQFLEFIECVRRHGGVMLFAGIRIGRGGKCERTVIGEMQMQVTNLVKSAGFNGSLQHPQRLMASGTVGHDGSVIRIRPVFDSHFGNGNFVAFYNDRLQQSGRPLARGSIVPTLDHHAICDQNGVCVFPRLEHFLTMDRQDFGARLKLPIEFQHDITRLRFAFRHRQLQFRDEQDFLR